MGESLTIRLAGEIDLSNAVSLRDYLLAEAAVTSAGTVVVDTSRLRFIDSSGIAALIQLQRALSMADRTLTIVARDGPVKKVIELSGGFPGIVDG